MRIFARPQDGRLGRALRELWPDANPLRRTCDRVEAWIMVVLCAMFLIGAPVAAVMAGGHVYGAGIRAQRTAHPVTAILLANAKSFDDGGQIASAPAAWTAPGGDVRSGRVHVRAGARAGSAVTAWVDGSGQLTGAPPRGADLVVDAAVAAFFAATILGALLIGAARVTRGVIRRRRLAGWESEWRSIEPRWARRS